jgi:hypothetical protein
MEIPGIGYTNSIGIAETFLKQKEGYSKVIFTSKSLQTSNFIILVLWISRDHMSLDFLSKSQLVA